MGKKRSGPLSPEDMDRYFNDPEFRRQRGNKTPAATPRRWLRSLLIFGLPAAIILGVYTWYLFSGLPGLEKIENPRPELSTRVFSADGEVLDQFFIKNRSQVALKDIPITVQNALIATEDKDYYSHWGVDAIRFIKAMIKNALTLFRRPEGASTITQQLARNLYLGHDDKNAFDTVTRKIREFITSIQLERNFTKEEILEFYLNVVYFGRGSYGIASASQQYFGKTVQELTLPETAMLIALVKGPAYYDPTRHPERAVGRRNVVLGQMLKYDYITEEEAERAKAVPIQLKATDEFARAGIAPHFVEYIRQQLSEKAEKYGFDIYRDGISVYTTLDSRMQRHANHAVEEHLAIYQGLFDKEWNWSREREALSFVIDQSIRTSGMYRNAGTARERDSVYQALKVDRPWLDSMMHVAQQIEIGFVAIDPTSGGIIAMVGGANFKQFKYGLNHVTQIRRQVGSAFKPFVYTVAIDNGYPPTFELLNQPVTIFMPDGKRWTPSNSDMTFSGKSTIREAIRMSLNLVAVRAVQSIAPINKVIDYAKRMGITSPLPPYESLALGAGEVSPLEMAAAFGVYPNHGVYVEPSSILRIEDKDGNIIEENFPMQREVLSEETAFLMTSMLEGVVNGGTGSHVRDYFQLPAAGKTGTTSEFADAWFVGFTPQISASVWVGFDNKSVRFKTWDGQGGRAAAPVWGRFMKYVYEDPDIAMPLQYFERPAGVLQETICTETKKLATQYCPSTTTEFFTTKTLPGRCDKHTTSKWKEGEEGQGTISF
ncbi:MAG: PBP1A family penicillin-binding protein [Ignavibacteriae bacterium]|nr:PBP1A family penicillin-binding protein [Ignavibacteriota bacterium]